MAYKGYNPYTLENHSTADLYYDATNQTLSYNKHYTSLYAARCIFEFIHPRVYETFRVHRFCTSCFEVWLYHSTSKLAYRTVLLNVWAILVQV